MKNDQNFGATGFFRVENAEGNWQMVDPTGKPFVSVGLNHADETNLKYPHNVDIWEKKYGSRDAWIREGVVKDLREWGFNTIGWTQEYVTGDWGKALDWFGDPIDLGHSIPWSAADLKKTQMPYVVQLRIAEIEDWNGHPWFPDVFSDEFDAYCEYLARSICLQHADDANLIGYFLTDIPAWLPHASGEDFAQLKGLDARSRNIKVYDIAYRYYETIARHIRRVDPHHLILGDRFNGNKGIPVPVLTAMRSFVDVLSVQYFTEPTESARMRMRADLANWHEVSRKPVLIADMGNWTATEMNPRRQSDIEDQAGRGQDYVDTLAGLVGEPWLVGWHWCAYVENTARGWGIKDPWDEPYTAMAEKVSAFNKRVTSGQD